VSTSQPIAVRADAPAVLELPPAHLELVWRPLRATDATAMHALMDAIETHDQTHTRHSYSEVLELLTGPGMDPEHDGLVGVDEDGTMRAYALVEIDDDSRVLRAVLRGGVHPGWRGRGIGRAILAWKEGRARQRLAASGTPLPARLAVMVEEQARDHRRLYAAAGFSPIRWYSAMRRDLRGPLPERQMPDGVRLTGWSPDLDEQVRVAHNEAFADHWGCAPQSITSWAQREASFVPHWSWVAVDSSGPGPEVVGYLMSARYEQDWPALGYTCGFTDAVGVRGPWRGRGVASALLVAAMSSYRDAGLEYASLRVDTANPSGAGNLYSALGYTQTHGYVMYSVEI
jgi:mycothiol synthase